MSASARLAAASAFAASLFAFALPALSADLYEPSRSGSAYDDPRYAEIYGDDPPAYDRYGEPPEDLDEPYRPRASLEEEDFEPPYAPDRYAGSRDACVPRHVVRDRLRAEGWSDFYGFEPRGRVVLVQARRPSGRLFDLTIDRCSGAVVEARPVDGSRFGSFADAPRRHWPRPY
jgi:hypothetical protein